MTKSPDAFRTISEVADWLSTPAHVLRFWESKFSQVKPVKRAGGRRYYRPNDMLLLGGLKRLLHEDGMTIKGAQDLLRQEGIKHVIGLSAPLHGDQEAEIIDEQPAEAPRDLTREMLPDPDQNAVVDLESLPPESLDAPVHDHEVADHTPWDLETPPTEAEPEAVEEKPEHFLQSASRSVDEHVGVDTTPEQVPTPIPEPPAGPLALETLRQTLMASGGIEKEKLVSARNRLRALRDRMAADDGPRAAR